MAALVATGCGLVVWGWFVAKASPGWDEYPGGRDAFCASAHSSDLMPGWPLWAIWFALVAASAAAVVVLAREGRGDWRLRLPAVLGVISAVILCPFWLAIAATSDCAL